MKYYTLCILLFISLFTVACGKQVNGPEKETWQKKRAQNEETLNEVQEVFHIETKEKLSASAIINDESGTVIEKESVDTENLEKYFISFPIQEGDGVYNRIIGKSYRDNEQITLLQLRYLKLLHYNYQHEIQIGELIVNEEIAQEILSIFQEFFRQEYEISSMHLVDHYWTETAMDGVAADAESMRQNNTSCFNYRVVPSKKSLSKHALGYAIDINPLENPYVIYDKKGAQILEGEGGDASYINRSDKRPHMIDHQDLAYRLFIKYGFEWGGDWSSSKDYQHFVKKQ